jgi:hypothetical protein
MSPLIDAKHCPHCKAALPQPLPRTCPECAGSLQQRFLASGCLTTKPPVIAFLLAGGLALALRGGAPAAAAPQPTAQRDEAQGAMQSSADKDACNESGPANEGSDEARAPASSGANAPQPPATTP